MSLLCNIWGDLKDGINAVLIGTFGDFVENMFSLFCFFNTSTSALSQLCCAFFTVNATIKIPRGSSGGVVGFYFEIDTVNLIP